MPIFACSKCGAVENTALSRYWMRVLKDPKPPPLCSECDPEIGKWHGAFPKESAKDHGYVQGPDGFLYNPGDPMLDTKPRRR